MKSNLDFEKIDKKIGELEHQIGSLQQEKRALIRDEEQWFDSKLTFLVSEEHIKLLKQFNVSWWDCEFGAPCIDPKRPYGNSSVYDDIAEIVGMKRKSNWDRAQEDWTDEAVKKMNILHNEMLTVLEIFVQNLGIKVGRYKRKDNYGSKWNFVEERK